MAALTPAPENLPSPQPGPNSFLSVGDAGCRPHTARCACGALRPAPSPGIRRLVPSPDLGATREPGEVSQGVANKHFPAGKAGAAHACAHTHARKHMHTCAHTHTHAQVRALMDSAVTSGARLASQTAGEPKAWPSPEERMLLRRGLQVASLVQHPTPSRNLNPKGRCGVSAHRGAVKGGRF